MRILIVHNYYQQAGGERGVFEDETRLLRTRGHEVFHFTAHNDKVEDMNRLELAGKTVWNQNTYRELNSLLRRIQPNVMHVHNTLPLISPAAYHAADAENIPVVQTLHNYRMMCPVGLLYRDGHVCEDCLGKSFAWPAVKHGCYQNSRSATAAVAVTTNLHQLLGTWTDKIDRYIALTQFARDKFIEGGLPADKIRVKPNFVAPDPGVRSNGGSYALFVGRLTGGKGLRTLINAWKEVPSSLRLKIVGDGPMEDLTADIAAQVEAVDYLGRRPHEEVLDLMGGARMVVVPSKWYETFGRVVAEAFAVGTPVLVSNLGAIAELVEPGVTGRRFTPGDSQDLAAQVRWMIDHPEAAKKMGDNARSTYEARFTADRNYQMLLDIYESVLQSASSVEPQVTEAAHDY